MKTSLKQLAALALAASFPILLHATTVTEYWPMHSGDIKYYTGTAGNAYTEFRSAGFSTYDMDLYVYDPDFGDYSRELSATVGYSGDRLALIEYGADAGPYSYDWSPAIHSLEETSLANSTSRTFDSVIEGSSFGSIPVTVTISVSAAGTVKVPAGTFNQCKNVSVKAKLQGGATVVSAQAWVLAPKVGQIKIAVINSSGSVVGWESLTDGTVGGISVKDLANQIPPTLTITSPTKGQRFSNSVATVTGTAKDNIRVTAVRYKLNEDPWKLAQTSNGWTNWSAEASLKVGSNYIAAYALDTMSNASPVMSVSFNYVLSAPLIVQTNGSGIVTPNYGGALLEIDKLYTLTAKPLPRNLFVGWSGSLTSTNSKLSFSMQSNLVLQANFVTNPFVALKGNFYGLFSETNEVRNPDHSGAFTLSLLEAGTYSGSFQLGAKKLGAKGAFNWLGQTVLSLKPSVTETVTVVLRLDVTNQTQWVEGTIGNALWSAPVAGYRAPVYPKGATSPLAGKYTLVLPGSDDAANQPGGDSYGTIAVSASGALKLAGKLADGTALSQGIPVSADGWWAWYSPLYSSKGSVYGWMHFTNRLDSNLEGKPSWIKPAVANAKYYPLGFTNAPDALGSAYISPTTNRVVALTNGVMAFLHGNLVQSITNNVLLSSNNAIVNLSSNKLSAKITLSTGLLAGSVTDTNTGKAIPFSGVLLQKMNAGYGYFLGTNQSGEVLITPSP
ncbi:MAG: hypothetical protein EPO07_19680 [Verrucomicrobia bacterium]|nr:MAG: hypothetical protein EPO07_19680 [Verrucomicrobiota bacterium]